MGSPTRASDRSSARALARPTTRSPRADPCTATRSGRRSRAARERVRCPHGPGRSRDSSVELRPCARTHPPIDRTSPAAGGTDARRRGRARAAVEAMQGRRPARVRAGMPACPRNAPLEQECRGSAEIVCRVHEHGTLAVPGTQPFGFMRRFLVRPGELEHEIAACVGAGRGDPGGLTARLERLAHPKRPPLLEVRERCLQRCQPRRRPSSSSSVTASARLRGRANDVTPRSVARPGLCAPGLEELDATDLVDAQVAVGSWALTFWPGAGSCRSPSTVIVTLSGSNETRSAMRAISSIGARYDQAAFRESPMS